MKDFMKRFLRMCFGFCILALGIVVVYQAKIGLGAWDVLSDGVAKTFGMKYGEASIVIGFAVLSVGLVAREKLGIGTILNILVIGKLVDLLLALNWIPIAYNYFVGLCMGVAGVFIVTFGLYVYISAGLGTGPRDTFLVFVTRKTGYPVGNCRMVIELCAVFAGFLLGGSVGVGTIIMAVLSGPVTHLVFRWLKFDIKAVNHIGFSDFAKLFSRKA